MKVIGTRLYRVVQKKILLETTDSFVVNSNFYEPPCIAKCFTRVGLFKHEIPFYFLMSEISLYSFKFGLNLELFYISHSHKLGVACSTGRVLSSIVII